MTRIGALGRTTGFGYDAAGNITAVRDPSEAATHFELDAYGRPAAVVAPNGATTRYIRDDFGRIVATVSPDSGTTVRSYDAADRLVASVDANGNQARYEYDTMGRIVLQRVTHVVNGGAQTVTRWRYLGPFLVAVDHPGQTERYGYDAHGRLSAKTVILTLAGGARASYTTRYRYDAMGQLAGIGLPDGSTLDYRRNGQNQIVALERQPVASQWLRRLAPRQTIVRDLERDVVGLRHFAYGNGIEAYYQRSKEGSLAHVVYRDPRIVAPGEQGRFTLETLLGVRPAYAASAPTLPGALGLPQDPKALLDHRYLWDEQRNLLYTRDRSAESAYAYDARDRLIASTTASMPVPAQGDASANAGFTRYYYDDNGNRLLAQEGIDQNETGDTSVRTSYAKDADRWGAEAADASAIEARYDAAGQPQRIGDRGFVWDAFGNLLEVRDGQHVLARYRYNHRGERIEKIAGGEHTYYLYQDRQLVAELDGTGRIRRQYVYLAGQPVAVIDNQAATAPDDTDGGLAGDIAGLWRAWSGKGETISYLQTNHLGAVEMATDASGKPIWQASYGGFGKLMPAHGTTRAGISRFVLNLRLPGQYADRETGLYYNDHRYYDPARGRYLTPDPLGLGGGANGYAYVNGNPLKYVAPEGLVLFAFDGTGNSQTPSAGDSISNVLKFYNAYDKSVNGPKYYITGIGTTNQDMHYEGSIYSGDGIDQRVALGFTFLDKLVASPDTPAGTIDIDVVGFSRGAAEARVWINQLVSHIVAGMYTSTDGKGNTHCVNLRFEGLWDTVSHLGLLDGNDAKYDFSIPQQVKMAVQAVALNEYRGGGTHFDGRSIFNAPNTPNSATRVEFGFIGSHADIGGGYGTGDLSDVALMWMIQEANTQGIKFNNNLIHSSGWDMVSSPIVHDKSINNSQRPGLSWVYDKQVLADRDFIYGNATRVKQTAAVIGGTSWAWAKNFVSYYSKTCGSSDNPAVGQVDMAKYSAWLATQGVNIGYAKPSATPLCN